MGQLHNQYRMMVLGLALCVTASAPLKAQVRDSAMRQLKVEYEDFRKNARIISQWPRWTGWSLMGIDLAEDQAQTLQLAEEQDDLVVSRGFMVNARVEQARKLRAARQASAASPNKQGRMLGYVKQVEELYALLTPEQQKVAAPEYAKLKAQYESAAKGAKQP